MSELSVVAPKPEQSTAASTPELTSSVSRPVPQKWAVGLPTTSEYYYDEERVDTRFPPDNLDLSDFWVVEVVRSNLKPKDRNLRWPIVFTQKYLSSKYINKGRAAKHRSDDGWVYSVVFDRFQMHGTEGEKQGLQSVRKVLPTTRSEIADGTACSKPDDANDDDTPAATASANSDALVRSTTKRRKHKTRSATKARKNHAAAIPVDMPPANSGSAEKKAAAIPVDLPPANSGSAEKKRKSETDKQTDAKRRKAMTYELPSELLDSDDGDKHEELQNEELRKEIDQWKAKYRKAHTQFIILAETSRQIHGTMQPLLNQISGALILLKKKSKTMSEDDQRTVLEYCRVNTTQLKELLVPINTQAAAIEDAHPELSDLLYNHDSEADFQKWIQEQKEAEI